MRMSSIFFKRNTVDLPEDLLVEILSRVSEASLARLRSTCKEWSALIKKDKRLDKKSKIIMLMNSRACLASIDLRESRDDIVKVTSQFSLKDPLSDSSKEVDIGEVFHCDGLLLCVTKDNRLVVWNPCSGETRWIQPRNSYKKFDVYALGKSSSNKYKILRLDNRTPGFMMYPRGLVEFEIYDFTSNSWRGVGETRDWHIPWLWRNGGIFVNGNTYLLASSTPCHFVNFLISFDFSTENFGSVSLPGDDLSYNAIALSVTREEQKLCLLASRACGGIFDIDVWMTTKIESTGAASWRKLLFIQGAAFCNGMNFLADRENKVIVFPDKFSNSESSLHIVGEDKYIQVGHHEAGHRCSFLVSYVPSFVQIQQEGSLRVGARKNQTRDL